MISVQTKRGKAVPVSSSRALGPDIWRRVAIPYEIGREEAEPATDNITPSSQEWRALPPEICRKPSEGLAMLWGTVAVIGNLLHNDSTQVIVEMSC